MDRPIKLGECPELFACLREMGYEPFFGKGNIQINIKEDNKNGIVKGNSTGI